MASFGKIGYYINSYDDMANDWGLEGTEIKGTEWYD